MVASVWLDEFLLSASTDESEKKEQKSNDKSRWQKSEIKIKIHIVQQ